MKFEVTFANYADGLVRAERRGIGLKEVDEIRNEFGPEITLDDIRGDVEPIYAPAVTVELDESTARKLLAKGVKEFEHDNSVLVSVRPKDAFNRYLKLVPRRMTRGNGFLYYMEWEIDTEAALKDWIKAGCPKEWNLGE